MRFYLFNLFSINVRVKVYISGELIMNKLIFARVLNDKDKLEEVRIDGKKLKFIFIKGESFDLNNLESIDLIGMYVKDNSKVVFFITSFLFVFITAFFTIDFYSLVSAIITSLVLGTLFAYTSKLFKIETKMYRIYLNKIPYNLLINDLDVYNLRNYLAKSKAIQTNE